MKKMKKLVSIFLMVLVMCASLAACGDSGSTVSNTPSSAPSSAPSNTGGPTDAQLSTLTDAFNQVAILYNDVATTAQANGWTADQETNAAIQTIGDILDPVGQALSGDMSALNGANFDALPGSLLELLPDLEALSEKVAAPYEGGEVAVSNEELEALAAAYNEVAVVFNEIYTTAESNGWLEDEETTIELQALTDMLTSINTGLTEDPSVFEGVDINSMIEELQNLGPELESLYNRVSYHYEDGK